MTNELVPAHPQYCVSEILAVWTAAAVPMAVLGWVVAPRLASTIDQPLGIAGIARTLSLTAGLMWQFVLAMAIVYREEGSMTWSALRRRCWLNTPRDPRTGKPQRRLWLWLIPLSALVPAFEFVVTPPLNRLWLALFPFLAQPPGHDFSEFLASAENRTLLVGAWWFFALFLVLAVFNTILGEELLFRGVLLPRMNGVFGRWDWAVNGLLFGAYHLHQPSGVPGGVLVGALLFALPTKHFRSAWMGIIIHSGQSVFFGVLILGLVLGFG